MVQFQKISPTSTSGLTMTETVKSADLEGAIADFMLVYEKRPIRKNHGGMRLNHSFATWFLLKSLNPSVIIESGVFRGHSTWLIEQACPNTRLFCLDPDLSRLVYRSSKATYLSKDFAQCSWSGIDRTNVVCFFDDHQNSYARLKDLLWAGFTRAIFEDNFPCGEGDLYTLRHMLAGFGHEHIQMSRNYLGNWLERRRRSKLESSLRSIGAQQQLIVSPNTEDRELFYRNCREYFEFPPIALNAANDWGTPYIGPYEAPKPIYGDNDMPANLQKLLARRPEEFSYYYIAYVELHSC